MRKSINRPEFPHIVACLISVRHAAKLTQVALAAKVKRTQGFVSAVERGDRRMDLLQVSDWCRACGLSMSEFGAMLDDVLAREKSKATAQAKRKTKARQKS